MLVTRFYFKLLNAEAAIATILTSNSITPDSAVVSSIITSTSAEISSDSSTSSVPGSRPSILPNEASSVDVKVPNSSTANMPVVKKMSTAITDLQELDNALHNALGRSVSTVTAPTRSQIAAFVAAAATAATTTAHPPADQALAKQQPDVKQTIATNHAPTVDSSAVADQSAQTVATAQNSQTKLNSPTTPLQRSTSVATFGIGSVGDPNLMNPPAAVSHTTLSYYHTHEMSNLDTLNGVHQNINRQQQHQQMSHVSHSSTGQTQWHGSPTHMTGPTIPPAALQEHFTTPGMGSQTHLCCIQNMCNPPQTHGNFNYLPCNGQSCSAGCSNEYFNSQVAVCF